MHFTLWHFLNRRRVHLTGAFLIALALLALGTSHAVAASTQPVPAIDSSSLSLLNGPNDAQARFDASAGQQGWDELGGGLRGIGGSVSALTVDNDGNLYVGGTFMWAGDVCSAHDGCEHIAMWDGADWHSLGLGVDGNVHALTVDDQGNLYVGGLFQGADGCTVAEGCLNIAMWNGESWSGLGDGIGIGEGSRGRVNALAVDSSGNLYAGGEFTRAGDCTSADGCNYLAMWDGDAWGPVGGGVHRDILPGVNALLIDESDHLYAGGYFSSAGGCTTTDGCRGIAKWDGAIWSSVGGGVSGTNGRVAALGLASNGDLFAAGVFAGVSGCTSANGCNNIARWDGANWHPLGSGQQGFVGFLAVDGSGNLYTRGAILSGAACPTGDSCQTMAMWDGAGWTSLGLLSGGFSAGASALAIGADGVLYAGGRFTMAGSCTTAEGCTSIAQWDGTEWASLGSGLYGAGRVNAIAVNDEGHTYIGGAFSRAGSCTIADGCNNIARWDGSTWHPLGSGLTGEGELALGFVGVRVLHLDGNGDLYAGGVFQGVAGCTPADGCNNIARWDGTSWHALGSGVDGIVTAIAHDDNGNLYAGGFLTGAGGCTQDDGCRHVAMWDGAAWHPLGSGIAGTDARVGALVVDDEGILYAAGNFSQAGDCTSDAGCVSVAMFDGAAWHPLSSGIRFSTNNGSVISLVLDAEGDVYAGGYFTQAGECTADDGCLNIARWDGTNWHPLGSGILWTTETPTGSVGGAFSLAVDRLGRLYAGGWFSSAGDCSAANGCRDLAKWDGTQWCSVDGTPGDSISALAVSTDDTLYAGGGFDQIGACTAGKGCYGVAQWAISPQACQVIVFLPSVSATE